LRAQAGTVRATGNTICQLGQIGGPFVGAALWHRWPRASLSFWADNGNNASKSDQLIQTIRLRQIIIWYVNP
jgi:hypothetical protein